MFVSHIRTAYGFSLTSEPRGLTIPRDPTAALAFAVYADRQADQHLAEGRVEAAERWGHAGLEARLRHRAGAR